MNKKTKKDLIKIIKKMDILSWGIKPRKNNGAWVDISLSGTVPIDEDDIDLVIDDFR